MRAYNDDVADVHKIRHEDECSNFVMSVESDCCEQNEDLKYDSVDDSAKHWGQPESYQWPNPVQ